MIKNLSAHLGPAQLADALTLRLGRKVLLTLTQNRRNLVSVRDMGGHLAIRISRVFLAAGPQERAALIHFLTEAPSPGHRGRLCDICAHLKSFAAKKMRAKEVFGRVRRPRPIHGQGQCHDLQAIFCELNHDYFYGACRAKIGWGRAPTGNQRRRSIQLGCFVFDDNLIRVHPALDQAFVPRFVVMGVTFHEMLHEALGVSCDAGRKKHHPPEFKLLEEAFVDYDRCRHWEQSNIHRLLRYRG